MTCSPTKAISTKIEIMTIDQNSHQAGERRRLHEQVVDHNYLIIRSDQRSRMFTNIISDYQILIKEVKLSARGYFGLATLDGTLLAFGGRGSDDQALASVGHQ